MRSDYIVQINGIKKSGKSTITFGNDPNMQNGIIHFLQKRVDKRIFVIDTAGVCREGTLVNHPTQLKDQIVKESDPDHEEHKSAREWMRRNNWTYVIRPDFDRDVNNYFKLFAHGRNKPAIEGVFIIDEIDDGKYGSRQKLNKHLERMIKYGGNKGQDFVIMCRRYMSVNKDIRTQADAVIAFRQNSKDVAKEIVRDQNVSVPPREIQKLGKHDFTVLGDMGDVPFKEDIEKLPTYTPVA